MIDDGHTPHVVIDGVVGILCKCCATCGDDDRASSHVSHAQVDFTRVVAFVASGQYELVVLGHLLGNGLGAVVKFAEAVFVGQCRVTYPFGQMLTERLGNGEDDASLADGVAFHEVELAVGMWIVLCVETVEIECPKQDGVLEPLFGQVAEVNAG